MARACRRDLPVIAVLEEPEGKTHTGSAECNDSSTRRSNKNRFIHNPDQPEGEKKV